MPRRTWESRPALLRRLPRRGHPRRCATLCGMVSNNPVALCHPLSYGRRVAPSKKDGRALEGETYDYSTPTQDCVVTSGQWERSPPSPSALCDHPRHRDAISATASPSPTLWKRAVTGHCRRRLCLVQPHVNSTLESSHGQPSNRRPLCRHPRSRSWTRTGHAMTPRQKRDSLGRPSTPWHCTPCIHT
jgi:hypothetical protein